MDSPERAITVLFYGVIVLIFLYFIYVERTIEHVQLMGVDLGSPSMSLFDVR